MKKILLTTLIIGWLFTAQSQVAGLKFKGIMNIPDPTNCILSFAKDTLYLINDQDGIDMARGAVIETMTYSLKDNMFTLQKVTGFSPCDNTVQGNYKLEMKDDKMFITLVSDACDARSYAWLKDPFLRLN